MSWLISIRVAFSFCYSGVSLRLSVVDRKVAIMWCEERKGVLPCSTSLMYSLCGYSFLAMSSSRFWKMACLSSSKSMTSAVYADVTLFGVSEARVVSAEEADPAAGVAFRLELLLLDEPLDALVELLDLSLEQFRHDLVKLLGYYKAFTNLLTGRLLLTR